MDVMSKMVSFGHFSYTSSSSLLMGAVWRAEIIIQQEEINVVHGAALHWAAKVIEFTWLIV